MRMNAYLALISSLRDCDLAGSGKTDQKKRRKDKKKVKGKGEHRAHGLPTQARARSTGRALNAHLRTNMLKPEST